MYSSVCSGGLDGIESYITNVEVDVSKGLPGFDMVGRLSNEVKEAKERVRVAIKNCGIELPPVHITVNISPADIKKTGTAYDLPIAVGIMNSLGHIADERIKDLLVIGELGLMGDVGRADGILPIVRTAREAGIERCMVPADNALEASSVEGIDIIPVKNLNEALYMLRSGDDISQYSITANSNDRMTPDIEKNKDFSDVIGQDACIRAALIAASGFHHMLIMGPPGSGKSMIAERMASIMPPLTADESLEVSTIYSVLGLLDKDRPYVYDRPYLSPHHSASLSSLTGGGAGARPGIISLSHKGILFMDELPEFDRECIEALREPMEKKKIQVSRARHIYTYPADFMLVASANPCPCGFYPNRNLCNCSDNTITRYRDRISGPVRDRIDIIVTSARIEADRIVTPGKTAGKKTGLTSSMLLERVLKAREIQKKRFAGTSLNYNSDITSNNVEEYCALGSEEKEYVKDAYEVMNLTARSYHKMLKVARTIADVEECDDIGIPHLSEALCYRGSF